MQITAAYTPRTYQVPAFQALLSGKARRVVTVWHRRAGKDVTAFNALWIWASQHIGNYGYFFPFANQGRKAIWHGITSGTTDSPGMAFRDFIPRELVASMHDNEMRITLTNGSTIQFIGTDNIDAKMGANFAGVVLSEYSLQDPKAWLYLSPILAANGGWAWFTYTPRGKQNHGYRMYEAAKRFQAEGRDWFCELLTIDDTQFLDSTILDEERAIGMTEAMINQEYYCSFEQENEGSYFGQQMMGLADHYSPQIVWNPRELVHTGWDLGVNDSTVIWFLQRGRGTSWQAIDYLARSNQGLEFYLSEMARKPYQYGTHIVPHDADQRHFPAITSTVEAAAQLGWDLTTVPRTAKRTQIDSMHRFLPRFFANSDICDEGLNALRNYERKWDEKLRVYHETPTHNWASHPTDALMTFVLGEDEVRDYTDDRNLPTHSTGGDFDAYGRKR